jgi:hypothetical protein
LTIPIIAVQIADSCAVAFKSPLIPLSQRGKIPLIPLFGKEGSGEILKILFWTDVNPNNT